jgi:hypothetical protein
MLLFALFTMTSFTAFADGQDTQSVQSQTAPSFVNVPSGGGGPSGTADLQWNPQTKVLTAIVHLSGAQPGSNYANHIHAGTCSTAGKILYPLNNVVTDVTGNGTATTTINNIAGGILASGWDVMVHSGPTAETSPMLCGDVVNPMGATSELVSLSSVHAMHMQ